MEYRDFYRIAFKLNNETKGYFSNEQVACFAYDYILEWEESIKNGKLKPTIIGLIENIVDVDAKYLHISKAKEILLNYIN